jgi:hypothetical protein
MKESGARRIVVAEPVRTNGANVISKTADVDLAATKSLEDSSSNAAIGVREDCQCSWRVRRLVTAACHTRLYNAPQARGYACGR